MTPPHTALNAPPRRLGYARVSTKDQRLRMQRDALEAAGCDRIFEDCGVSGGARTRPGLEAMLAELRAGDAVVVLKLDRLGRSVQHLAELLVRFQRDGVHFRSLGEGLDTTTPGGKLVFHIFAAFAEFHRDIIRENTRDGLAAARRRGSPIGRPLALTPCDVAGAHRHVIEDGMPISDAADGCGVSESTLRRAFKRLGLDAAA